MSISLVAFATLALLAIGCGGSSQGGDTTAATESGEARALEGQTVDDRARCQTEDAPNREVSEYDTSGDAVPDVRKVFLVVGSGSLSRLVLICREADLNGDGRKDVVRHYDDDGRPTREEADRDFDGTMDEVSYFENGRIVRQEMDANRDGRVDAKVFFEAGKPLRAERDMSGRSAGDQWRPDRWEYFEDGHMVRMGTDLDGDGRVDRWDRDEERRAAAAAAAAAEAQSEVANEGASEGEGEAATGE